MTNTNFVLKQINYLIMLTLLEDEDYQKYGVKSTNLKAVLIENKRLWMNVGQVRDDKQFETSLKGNLSALDKKFHYLRRTVNGSYVMGSKFEEGFKSIVSDLWNYFDIEVDVAPGICEDEHGREKIASKVLNEEIDFSFISEVGEKNVNMLTMEQATKLVKYGILFGELY